MPFHRADASALSCICLTAPTACGKTELALELAQRLPIEIVSVDSAMVYRGMDIGTAKPSAAVRVAVPHHLIDVADPAEPYSAGRFLTDATTAIAAIRARGRLPLLVGGTLLYLRALTGGLAPLPAADPQVRAALDAEAARLGWPALHRRLAEVDPVAARRVAPNDRQRIQRALEVYMLTGQPLSALQRMDAPGGASAQRAGASAQRAGASPQRAGASAQRAGTSARRAGASAPRVGASEPRPQLTTIALVPSARETLHARIERRFDAMVEAGFVTEVQELKARGDLGMDTPSMRAVGYRQVWGYLAGQCDWPVARAGAITATRQLAKRQMTWLRSEREVETLDAFAPDLAKKLLERIGSEFEQWS